MSAETDRTARAIELLRTDPLYIVNDVEKATLDLIAAIEPVLVPSGYSDLSPKCAVCGEWIDDGRPHNRFCPLTVWTEAVLERYEEST